MKNNLILTLFSFSFVFTACTQSDPKNKIVNSKPLPVEEKSEVVKAELVLEQNDDRSGIIKRLQEKVANGKPLVVHVKVPLCDNENQGIVPTSPSLGNGMDLKQNLYWATSKGMKRYFKELPNWKLLKSELNPNENVLERVVFLKTDEKDKKVYLVAEAYRGDKMVECLEDYFNALAGIKKDILVINNDTLGIDGNADLIAFNGHNGLMDENVQAKNSVDGISRDAVSIACVSGKYFKPEYAKTNSYPLVCTEHLLYPGAFILEGIINEWCDFKSDKDCKVAAGKAYYKNKPESGPNGSQNLFCFGW